MPTAGIKPISLAFQTSVLTITPPRFPDVTTLPMRTWLCMHSHIYASVENCCPKSKIQIHISRLLALCASALTITLHRLCMQSPCLFLFTYVTLACRVSGNGQINKESLFCLKTPLEPIDFHIIGYWTLSIRSL